jgi:hypothetical protein
VNLKRVRGRKPVRECPSLEHWLFESSWVSEGHLDGTAVGQDDGLIVGREGAGNESITSIPMALVLCPCAQFGTRLRLLCLSAW